MKDKINFNRYVFLSSFSRSLIEAFIGTILYKAGFSLNEVILYYLLVNIFSFILAFPCNQISIKYSNKLLSVIGVLSFAILQLKLNCINFNIIYIYEVSFLFAFYRRCYWIARRFYTLKIIKKDNISKDYSIISIVNQLGLMISSFIGSILLEFVSIKELTIISIILFLISIVFLNKIEFRESRNNIKVDLIGTLRKMPKSSIIHIGCYELQNVVKFLMPLYIFINVQNKYTAIGEINLIVNIATLVFTYLYGNIINGSKNYLKVSIVMFICINILKLNTYGMILVIVSFIEGFVNKMYEQSFQKEYLSLSKKFEYYNYNFVYEIIQNSFRTVSVLIIYLFIKDIRTMIYIILVIISVSLFSKFIIFENKKHVISKYDEN